MRIDSGNHKNQIPIVKAIGLTGRVARSYAAGHEYNLYEFDLLELLNLDERQFSSVFGKLNWSIDVVTFKRNVILALGNIVDRALQRPPA